jgi:mycofactocin precursor
MDVERAASPATREPVQPEARATDEPSGLIVDELLVEDVSIDGMCGVY